MSTEYDVFHYMNKPTPAGSGKLKAAFKHVADLFSGNSQDAGLNNEQILKSSEAYKYVAGMQ